MSKYDKWHFRRTVRNMLGLLVLGLTLSGCATSDYTTHYGFFEAENTAGELRQFRLYWQTVRYEGWSENTYKALPVIVEAQCSERPLRFFDASYGEARRCLGHDGEGIHLCSDGDKDLDARGLPLADESLCGRVTDRNGAQDILSLEGDVMLYVHCRPRETEVTQDDRRINMDYLMPSALPYVISTKRVEGRDIESIVPPLFNHSSVCDPDA
ncbi:MAG: hypothetical protein R3183_11805 [Oleiphilaceae bacterium]|nr:hypothetical protein [Oleiphilaceae bacterium]